MEFKLKKALRLHGLLQMERAISNTCSWVQRGTDSPFVDGGMGRAKSPLVVMERAYVSAWFGIGGEAGLQIL